ncbi:LPS export ABC transporter periplasmic protein LptC [Polluticoccus soli]|uniref:LPS export ABC transporter periplasmic protein LptC n=1 Tax=Polluticoccus soli TaxID=3034150 RepID=UPI0023E0E64F|nr:LPS export ABC transporter periplasmic protein LptC [Flavipsychrobacter sp. JY13-12]
MINPRALHSLFIVAGSVGILSIASCKNDPKEIDRLVTKHSPQEDRAEDVTILYSEHGHLKARLYAKEFIRNEVAKPPFTDMKKGLKVEFFDDSLKVESVLTARYARYYEKQENVLIRDSIVVVNKKGERLNTEELVWNQSIRKFYTEKFVRITTPTQVMYGDGLEANEDFSWYEIKNPKGIVQVNKSELPE